MTAKYADKIAYNPKRASLGGLPYQNSTATTKITIDFRKHEDQAQSQEQSRSGLRSPVQHPDSTYSTSTNNLNKSNTIRVYENSKNKEIALKLKRQLSCQ